MAERASPLPNKRQVAASFSKAAATYDSVAELQRAVGHELLALLPADWQPRRWVDLGSGTGYFSQVLAARFNCVAGAPEACGMAIDIAQGMLQHARQHADAPLHYVAGDAESLPLRDQSCELIFSSLAIQWCDDLPAVLREAQRVLQPGGVFAFASLVTGTLQELRDSWAQVDGQVHVNRFRAFAAYRQVCAEVGWDCLHLAPRTRTLFYPDVRSLTHELKALGAHNLNPGRPGGLTGRARLQGLLAAYETFRQAPGLPATYQVVYGVLRKPLARSPQPSTRP